MDAASGTPASPRLHPAMIVAAIAVLVAAIYGAALPYPFELDDLPCIVANHSLDSANPGDWRLVGTPRRVVAATFAVTRHAVGADPAWFRVANLAIHVANGCLAFL